MLSQTTPCQTTPCQPTTFQTILFEVAGGIARLTLNRPDKLNSFTAAMHAEVQEALAAVRADSSVRVLVLTGAGRAFCAGADLADPEVAAGADLGAQVERYYAPLVLALRRLPIPVVCAVNGVAAGAGANLALAADIVLAARSASFIQSFCKLGLTLDTGGTWMLPRLVGMARATGLAMLGEKLSAERAEEWGLIWRAVPDQELAAQTTVMAEHFASAATRALALTKQALHESTTSTLEQQLAREAAMMRELGNSADYREGVAAFAQKRPPNFTGA